MTDSEFVLQRVQPALIGLIDGSMSTLAPIFAVAIATQVPRYAFLAGVATSIAAGISMAYSEGLSDTGEITGRGSPVTRGVITGVGTFVGGILHTLPFLIPDYHARARRGIGGRGSRADRAGVASVPLPEDELPELRGAHHARRHRDRPRQRGAGGVGVTLGGLM